jgi:stress-induced morphogen
MSGLSAEVVGSRIKESLEAVHVEVTDTSGGCGASFDLIVVSDKFEGLSLLDRHRLVNSVFEEELKGAIHALTMKTWTLAQFEKKKQQM